MTFYSLFHQASMILFAIIGVGFLIGFHELGHFLLCKLFKVSTPSFSIGFGPRIFQKKIGETTFALSAIPLGGYVEIAGAAEVGQGDQKEAHRTDKYAFSSKPYYQKMAIIGGGILFNLAFAYAVLVGLFAAGIPKTPMLYPMNATPIIEKIIPNSPAEIAELHVGDKILQINNSSLSNDSMKGYLTLLSGLAGQTANLIVERGERTFPVNVQLGNGTDTPLLGAIFETQAIPAVNLSQAIQKSIATVHGWISSSFNAFKSMAQKQTTKGLGGPLAIISETVKGTHEGIVPFLLILCLISVNLAVLNIIPLPIFDGGQALFYTLEAITGRSLGNVRMYIHYISWLFVMVLGLYLTCKDLIKICL